MTNTISCWFGGCFIIKQKTILANQFIVILSLISGGCRVGTVGGVSLTLCSYERGLWFDHNEKHYQPAGFAMKLDIVIEHMILRIMKFWEPPKNPWKGDKPWFVIRSLMIGPFISLTFGKLEMYYGFKTFEVENLHRSPNRYGKWMHENEFPQQSDGAKVSLQPSVSLIGTRWKWNHSNSCLGMFCLFCESS